MFISLKKEDFCFIGLLLVILCVYLINLGLMPLLADEPIRALVSLEMVLSGNFIFPTLGGDPYLNKPPLFNWMLALFCFNKHVHVEWCLRIIPLLSFLATAILHYAVCSKHVSKQIALWSSIAFLTCGRILFYDSMMGYIDPVFSLIIVSNFYFILILSKEQKNVTLFIFSYILCTIAFFLKGLPACTFQVFTLLGGFIYRNRFRDLVSCAHVCGISIFIICIAIYYYEYGNYGSIETVLRSLLSQSTQRTPVSTSVFETICHILQFPFQFILDFMPFSLFILLCFNRKLIPVLKDNDFVFTSFAIIASNIWLYWISAETRPRYLFMFLPLFFTIAFYVFGKFKTARIEVYLRYFNFLIVACLILVLCILPFLQRFNFISNSVWIAAFSICLLIALSFFFYKRKISNLFMLVLILIVLRADFDLFILPLRKKEAPESINKLVGIELAKLTKGHPLFTLYKAPMNDDIRFYATLHRGEIIYNQNEEPKQGVYYVVQEELLDTFQLKPIYHFSVTYKSRTLYLAKK